QTSTVSAGVETDCEKLHAPSKSTLTTQQIERWMPTATEARKVIVSDGKLISVSVIVGRGGNGWMPTPTDAVSASEAEARPSSTSTDAWPLRMTITVSELPPASIEIARVTAA